MYLSNDLSSSEPKQNIKMKHAEKPSEDLVKIELNSYDVTQDQKNIAPSSDCFDLNSFYNQGYTTDETNEQEMEAIQQGILSNYNIDSTDEAQLEKLTIIYETLLDEETNAAFLAECKENGLQESYSEDELIETVENTMAKLSHDGQSVGDLITLPEVDFSSVPLPEIGSRYKNKITINNAKTVEFDGEIEIKGNTYKGTINGSSVVVEQKQDGTCVVSYYDSDKEDANLAKEITYLPNAQTVSAVYWPDENNEMTLISKTIEDENGKLLSGYRNHGTYSTETRYSDGGFETTYYDKSGKVQKCMTAQEDESGLLTIATYKDKGKKREISKDSCFRYKISDNETRFKFSSGSQNSIDFKEDGNDITTTITRGSLKTSLTVQKNADGTYLYNNKTFSTLEEVAVELNSIEMKPSYELNGVIDPSKQGFGIGDCGLLSAVSALSYTEYGREILNNSIEYDDEGGVKVYMKAIDKEYTVTKEEIENSIYGSGDKDVLAMELAVDKAFEDIRQGRIGVYQDVPFFIESANELWQDEYRITANCPQETMYLLSGKSCIIDDEPDRATKIAALDELQNYGGIALTVATFDGDGSTALRTDTDSCYVAAKTTIDAFGNPVALPTAHAYAVKEVNTKSNGERVVTIVNPWDTSQEVVLGENEYLNFFEKQYSMQIRGNEEYPQYYYNY